MERSVIDNMTSSCHYGESMSHHLYTTSKEHYDEGTVYRRYIEYRQLKRINIIRIHVVVEILVKECAQGSIATILIFDAKQ